ncbi:MAG: HD domain-containing phosphohydrolase [Candidatus Firestonebacteria bacterium]
MKNKLQRQIEILKEKNSNQEKKLEALTIMYEVSKSVASLFKLSDILKIILNKATIKLKCEIGSILLVDEEGEYLTIAVAKGLSQKIVLHTRLKIGERISGWVVKHKKPLLVKNIEKDKRFTIRNSEKYYNKSLISVPIIIDTHKVVGVININNKHTRESFSNDDLQLLKALASQAAIAIEKTKLYQNLQDVYMRTIKALAVAIDAKDHYTHNHSENVTKYAVEIAEEMGLNSEEVKNINHASQLHDLGKIGIQDYILSKSDKLSAEEWKKIKEHSLKSAEILEPLVFLNDVIEMVKQHHERYDGAGYPYGVKGDNIRIGARIMAVADAYDAMISDRPYRNSMSQKDAIAELEKCSGKQFDPQVVHAFLRVLERRKK